MSKAVDRLPVLVLTGFLGSGKTTLLNRLLHHPELKRSAVIINEFGEIAIDHILVETALEDTVVLRNGCICCTQRGDLASTLVDLAERRNGGEIPPFARVILETTGLAEPTAVLETLLNNPAVEGCFVLQALVATVDAVNGADQLTQYPEALRQVAAANLVVLTKTDIASHGEITEAQARLAAINPVAEVRWAQHGDLNPEIILDAPRWEASMEDVDRWLPGAAVEPSSPFRYGTVQSHRVKFGAARFDRVRFHADQCAQVEAFSFVLDDPVPWGGLMLWLRALVSLRGDDLLRVKGLVAVQNHRGPRVLQGVQQLLHPHRDLPEWPDGIRRTRLVLIARNMSRAGLQRSLIRALTAG